MNLEPKGGIHEPVPFSLPHRKEVRASTECKKNSDPWSSSPELQQQTYKIHTFEYVTRCVWRHSAWFETAALEYMPEFIYILLGGCKLQSWIIYYCSQHLFHKLACQQCKWKGMLLLWTTCHICIMAVKDMSSRHRPEMWQTFTPNLTFTFKKWDCAFSPVFDVYK